MKGDLKAMECTFGALIRNRQYKITGLYDWRKSKVSALWDDIKTLAESEDADEKHFLGTMIIVFEEIYRMRYPRFTIVDGRQRIITLYLMLYSLYEESYSIDELDEAGFSRKIHEIVYVESDLGRLSEHDEQALILYNDLPLTDLLSNNDHDLNKLNRLPRSTQNITEAYKWLNKEIHDFIHTDNYPNDGRFVELLKALVNQVNYVLVQLSNAEDAIDIIASQSRFDGRGLATKNREAFKQLFISYSRADAPIMQQIKSFLIDSGYNVWTDENITPGTTLWENALETNIEKAGAVIILMSPNSKESEWVKQELNYAYVHEVKVFPILIYDNPKLSVPLRLAGTQWVQFTEENNISADLGRLIEQLDFYLAPPDKDY